MYKLPMFGCSDPQQVLTEIANATKTFPNAYIRCAAFASSACCLSRAPCTLHSAVRPDQQHHAWRHSCKHV